MSKYKDKPEEAVELLQKFAPYEGTERGETWSALAEMHERFGSYISEDLKSALEAEIIETANYVDRAFIITQKQETLTRNYTVLEYAPDDE